ncbi:ABC transporter permease [Piscinibacter sakaiensis]|uniref:ABC transporter permease n=1 Tax=Piscinibacter sakaiensis TaxID=1547922 RepID=UPI0037269CC0
MSGAPGAVQAPGRAQSSVEHALPVLALLALAAVAAAGPDRGRLLRRTLWTVLAFNLSVSAGLVLVSAWQVRPWAEALVLINLRVLLLVFLGHWFVARVNLLQALARWPTLALVATVATGQAAVFARTLRDFRLAFRSRNPVPARPADQARHAAAQVMHLLDKATAAATESAQAMRSRGCFDD